MQADCDHYFLSKTAVEIWQKDDAKGQSKMYDCLKNVYKESFFRQVVFKSKTVPYYRLTEIAESVFNSAWTNITLKGKEGKIVFEEPEYTGFFYTVFKRNYLKLSAKEIKYAEIENKYRQGQETKTEMKTDADKGELFSPETQRAMNKISPNCRQLLMWKHIDGLSHDEIAGMKNIDRDSSIKMVSRCGQQLLQILRDNRNKPAA
ncbi:MAG: hypothetical protein M3015_12440 [Bacteroidota bacterium]|nr:hypothetical protein [Bacteroidota bacterium]